MPVVRFVMLLSLVVWIGAIVFFAFVVAPTLFSGVLPTRELAGAVVSRSLTKLHWMGLACGVAFSISSMVLARFSLGAVHPLATRNVLVYAMIALTLVAQFAIFARMETLRTQMGQIDAVALDDTRRVEFDRLHQWSTRVEGAVLLLGLVALYLTAQRLG
jgi:hypothetical protein